ncbi:MAG: HAD family hydrolase [Victivallaceae bacterium]|nr:HAD family phosphatase [Victivallaceae bacterium]
MNGIKFYWFDMDHTLIDNDCDVSWKHFVAAHGLGPADSAAIADRFFEDYRLGRLDQKEFAKFQYAEFTGKTPAEMRTLAREHFMEMVLPKVYLKAKGFIEEIQEDGGRVGILTSTNSVLAGPVAEYFKADLLIGTELEIADGKFTGAYLEPYAGGPGKVELLGGFARAVRIPPDELAYFGDSMYDRFVLDYVGHPFATNPSPELRELAAQKNWQIMNFKGDE